MFGNVLEVQVSFSVPRLRLEDLRGMLTDMLIGGDDIRVALVVYTTFRLKDSDIGGFLVLILGVSSLERLLAAVGEWAARTGDE
jgi:chemotaxis protein CheC